MIISVKNAPKERDGETTRPRSIERANAPALNWGYALHYDKEGKLRLPTVRVDVEGKDGKVYEVRLSDADIEAINKARRDYDEEFAHYTENC